jgi:hypothetical protein
VDVTCLGIMNRAFRNISRRKIRALLVVIALGFSLAILISIPPGITASQTATQDLTQSLGNTIVQTEASINQTMTQIDCSLTPSFAGFGFTGNFTPGQFGGSLAEGEEGTSTLRLVNSAVEFLESSAEARSVVEEVTL